MLPTDHPTSGNDGQKRVKRKRTLPIEEYQKVAQKLIEEFGTYYGVAKAIGDRNLRANVRRLLLEGEPPSRSLQEALDNWLDVDVLIIEAAPGVSLFGDVGLLNTDAVVFVMARPEWDRHMMECQVCGELTPRWSGNQKYCRRHSYSSKEGRRYWHEQKTDNKEETDER